MKSGLWLYFIYLAVALTLSSGAVSAAEGDTMEVLSDYEFAVKTFGEKSNIAKALKTDPQKKDDKTKKIICGKEFCDSDTQNCMVCINEWTAGARSGTSTDYKCIAKDDLPENYNKPGVVSKTSCYLNNSGGTNKNTLYSGGGVYQFKSGNCMQGSDGKQYCFEKEKDNITITYAGDSYKGCEVLPVKLYKQKECFFCPLF